jgi:hypothetical protein
MSEAMPLTCGHKATRWVTVFYPNVDAPYRRFCEIECMIWWHEQETERVLMQLRKDHPVPSENFAEDKKAGL